MLNDILDKDTRSRKIMYFILALSTIVSAVDLFFSVMGSLEDFKSVHEVNILMSLSILVPIFPLLFQFAVSIKGLKEASRSGSYKNAGQTALMIIAIFINPLGDMFTEIINQYIYGSITINFLKPFLMPAIIFLAVVGLSSFVKHFMLHRKFKLLKLLQIIMSLLVIGFYFLNLEFLLGYVDDGFIFKLCFYINIAIVAMLAIEGLSCIFFLLRNRKDIYKVAYNDFEKEIISNENGKITEKVYIEKGVETNIFTKIAYVLGIVFIVLVGAFITIEIIDNIQKVYHFISNDLTSVLDVALNLLYIVGLLSMTFAFIKVSIGFLKTKKNLYTSLVNVATFTIMYAYFSLGFVIPTQQTSIIEYYGPIIVAFSVIGIFSKINNGVEESIKAGEWGSKISKKIAIVNIVCSIITFAICLAIIILYDKLVYILICIAMLLSLLFFIIELKYPKSEYFIIKRKVKKLSE